MSGGPRVLVTNDDGVGAQGLLTAAGAVRAVGATPLVVAPSRDMSVMGTALGGDFGDVELRAERIVWTAAGLGDVAVFRLPSYPAAVVTLAAVGAFGRRPDMVLAGINHGANTGVGILHSATIGAALTGGMAGIPAVAVSVAGPADHADWARCERFAAVLLEALGTEFPVAGALNVNMPGRPPDDPRRIGWRTLATTGPTTARLERQDFTDGWLGLRMRFEPTSEVLSSRTDSGALLRGNISLTWLPLPHGRPAPAQWRRAVLHRLREGWSRACAAVSFGPG